MRNLFGGRKKASKEFEEQKPINKQKKKLLARSEYSKHMNTLFLYVSKDLICNNGITLQGIITMSRKCMCKYIPNYRLHQRSRFTIQRLHAGSVIVNERGGDPHYPKNKQREKNKHDQSL